MNDAAIRETFRGKSVLVTGHTGFKGSWLTLWLHDLGARVTGYSLAPPTSPSNFVVSHVDELAAENLPADIRDVSRVAAVIDKAQPDVIFHLAAQTIVRESYLTPRETFETNVMGTINVLEAVRRRGRPCVVVVVTSDKCYENREQTAGYRETDPLGGHDPYSASKGAAEIAVAAYRASFFPPERVGVHRVKLATARAGNVIGGGDWAKDRIIVDAVTYLARREPVPVRNPRAVRPWQHVLEPLSGYLLLAAKMLASEDPELCSAWNFGPAGEPATVQNLVERFCAAWGGGQWKDAGDPAHPPETHTLQVNIEKAAAKLGWRPRWDLAQTVAKTAAWYRVYYDHPEQSMRPLCLADITAYSGDGRCK